MRKVFACGCLTVGLVLALAGVGVAHETIIKPGAPEAAVGKSLPFGIHSAHVFIVSEELETAADVKAFVWSDGKAVETPLTADEKAFVFKGEATFSKPGAGLILVHRLPQVWSMTPEGMKKGTKKELPGATKSTSYEKFAKAVVPVGGSTAGFDTVVGQKLELVPLTDPAAVKVGGEMDVKVLLDGQATPATVLATYDGFTKNPNTYAYYTETDDTGVARIKITHPGLWLVRTELKLPGTSGSVDQEGLRSTLTFFVK